jgi:acyl-CoA synthetase (AMP-forming)/AMP-acid ligase II
MVTHGNLLANEEMIHRAFGTSAESVIVGWLPVYHDMSLIGNVLQPVYVGARCVMMSPLDFLRRPGRWLEAISRYRGTTSGGPNFAYDLCAGKVTADERERRPSAAAASPSSGWRSWGSPWRIRSPDPRLSP